MPLENKSFRKFGATAMDHGNREDGNGIQIKADFLLFRSQFTYLLTQNGKSILLKNVP